MQTGTLSIRLIILEILYQNLQDLQHKYQYRLGAVVVVVVMPVVATLAVAVVRLLVRYLLLLDPMLLSLVVVAQAWAVAVEQVHLSLVVEGWRVRQAMLVKVVGCQDYLFRQTRKVMLIWLI
jgi:hypothetical protein